MDDDGMKTEFLGVLGKIAGTKESIRKAKDWIFGRPEKIDALARILRDHVVATTNGVLPRDDRFTTALYAIYLLNDVFFNSTKDEPFRDGCLPYLPDIVTAATEAAPGDSKEKVLRVVDLWGTKQIFEQKDMDILRKATTKSGFGATPQEAAEEAKKLMTASFPTVGPTTILERGGLTQVPPVPPKVLQPLKPPDLTTSTPAPLCDLAAIPVGIMAGLVRVALNAGHEPWKPLDVAAMPALMPPAVEPGRLDARIAEFYRVLEKNRLKRRVDDSRDDDSGDQQRRRRVWGPPPPPTAPPPIAPPPKILPIPRGAISTYSTSRQDTLDQLDPDRPIGDDNVGKQMLRGMGWQEGNGLGVAGTGRAVPVADAGQTDKIGIGSRAPAPPPEGLDDTFLQYRNQRSVGYKARWNS